MASDDIAQLADTLAKTHVGDEKLTIKGLGLKLDNAASVEELVREIEQHQFLRALCLEGNTLGVDAARAIAKALESKDMLQRCYWSDIFTGRLRSEIPTALRCLGDALMCAGVRLTELDLSDNAFGPDGVKGIEGLLKSPSCHTLRELKLNNCGMGVGGGKILAEALIECHRRSTEVGAPLRLRVFVAGRNRLENEGARALAKAFQLIGSLEEIYMPQNGINHAGVVALASAMRHNRELRVLNFNDNTFTKKGTLAMAKALTHLRSLQVVNFGDCLVRSEGAIALAAVIREGVPVLKELNLSYGEITEAAALVVARAVMDKPQMERLDLNGNCLGEDGCEALREMMEEMDKADMLGSLSEDEGEPDDEDNEDENEVCENSDEDDGDDEVNKCNDYNDGVIVGGTGLIGEDSPERLQSPAKILAFISSPSQEKLLQLGEMRTQLQHQVDPLDSHKAADVLLKIASLYNEDSETKTAVFEIVDSLLMKLLSSSCFHAYCFLSTLLVMMGLLKGEEKTTKVSLVPGQLLCLEHAVQQEYFEAHHAALLQTFMSKNADALKSCSGAGERLSSALKKKCDKEQ